MDPRLLEHYGGDVSRANIQPRGARGGSSPATEAPRREPLALPRAAATSTTRRPGTRARASRRARRGARSPTTGPAPTAACATRSTSSRTRDGERVSAAAATIGGVARRPHPLSAGRPQAAARDPVRRRPRRARSGAPGRRSRCRTSPRAAGVSRQTLYKEFGSRDEFAQAFVIHEGERFLDGVDAAVREHLDDPRAAVGAALEAFLRTAGEDPLVRILLSDDGTGGMLPFVTTQGMPVVQWATARLTATIARGLAAGAARTRSSCSPSPWSGWRSATSRPPATRPRRPPPSAGELLGPFIDRALGAQGDTSRRRSRLASTAGHSESITLK